MHRAILGFLVAFSLACGGFASNVKDTAMRQTLAKMNDALDKLPPDAQGALRPVLRRVKDGVESGSIELTELVDLGLRVDAAVADGALSPDEIRELASKVDELTR